MKTVFLRGPVLQRHLLALLFQWCLINGLACLHLIALFLFHVSVLFAGLVYLLDHGNIVGFY